MEKEVTSSCPVPNGILVIIGGKEDKGEGNDKENPGPPLVVLKEVIKVTGKENPIIQVNTTATEEPEESFEDYEKIFHELGVTNVQHLHNYTRKEAADFNYEENAEKADAVFFTGGDQLKLTSIYGGTSFLTKLKHQYIYHKLVIAGTSAGAMALSTPMIFAGTGDDEMIAGAVKITTGLEFLKDVCVDTHFVHRGRFVRMAQVIVTNPTCIGMGIEEDTAIVVRNGLDAEIIGSGVVIIIDGFHIAESNILAFVDKEAVSIRDLKVQILSKGNTYQIPQLNPPHI